MPRISLWDPKKRKDYNFIDRSIKEHFYMGGTAVFIHKYAGPKGSETETAIEDVLFLENRTRKYEDDIYELRGHYSPQDTDFDLSQFGLFLSNDIVFVTFHINDMIDKMGRKLMSGDVLEFPHLKDDSLLDEDIESINRFYVVEDASNYSQGYSPKWQPHIWRVKAKVIQHSEEYVDILGTGENEDDLVNIISTYDKNLEITDKLVEEANENVSSGVLFYDNSHYFIQEIGGAPQLYWNSSSEIPPNSEPLAGSGDEFPEDLEDGDYFLRTDYTPARLFRKCDNKYLFIGDDLSREWKPYSKTMEKFIDNDESFTDDDCNEIEKRQALSKVVKPKTDD